MSRNECVKTARLCARMTKETGAIVVPIIGGFHGKNGTPDRNITSYCWRGFIEFKDDGYKLDMLQMDCIKKMNILQPGSAYACWFCGDMLMFMWYDMYHVVKTGHTSTNGCWLFFNVNADIHTRRLFRLLDDVDKQTVLNAVCDSPRFTTVEILNMRNPSTADNIFQCGEVDDATLRRFVVGLR